MIRSKSVCPVEHSGMLDSRFRRMLQNPTKILAPFIRQGMSVLDLGCGPGFFTLDMARLVGAEGKVYAVDLQQGMLDKLDAKTSGTELARQIRTHRCGENSLQLPPEARFDFILAFYVLHEIPGQASLFKELADHLSPGGRILVVEPPLHVSQKEFRQIISLAEASGLTVTAQPRVLFSKTAMLQKTSPAV